MRDGEQSLETPLKPCPFCGSSRVFRYDGGSYWTVPQRLPNCGDCGATAPTETAWNRRATWTVTSAFSRTGAEEVPMSDLVAPLPRYVYSGCVYPEHPSHDETRGRVHAIVDTEERRISHVVSREELVPTLRRLNGCPPPD